MLVGSCLEINVIALFSLVARDRVCKYDLVGISDMRFAGCIGDRSGNVLWFLTVCTHGLSPPVFLSLFTALLLPVICSQNTAFSVSFRHKWHTGRFLRWGLFLPRYVPQCIKKARL